MIAVYIACILALFACRMNNIELPEHIEGLVGIESIYRSGL